MPIYKFKAVDATGKYIESIQNAATKKQLLEMLRANSWMPVNIEEYNEGGSVSFDFLSPKVSSKDVAVFAREFYTMLNTGISINNCLDTLREQSESKRLREAVTMIYEDVQTGVAFSASLRKLTHIFPEMFIYMSEVGEANGTLETVMHRLAVHYDKEWRISSKIRNSMIYPVVLMFAVIGVVVGLLGFVFPSFVTMFDDGGVPLPGSTKALMAISNSFTNYWYVYFGVIIVVLFLFYKFSQADYGSRVVDGAKLDLPIFGRNLSKIISSRFTGMISMLTKSGIPLDQAIDLAAKAINNKVVEDKLNDVKEQVNKGINLSVPIKESGVFSPMVSTMIAAGEESGKLEEALEKTADFYDVEVESALQSMVGAMEPMLIVVISVIVGFIVIALFLPMLGLIGTA